MKTKNRLHLSFIASAIVLIIGMGGFIEIYPYMWNTCQHWHDFISNRLILAGLASLVYFYGKIELFEATDNIKLLQRKLKSKHANYCKLKKRYDIVTKK